MLVGLFRASHPIAGATEYRLGAFVLTLKAAKSPCCSVRMRMLANEVLPSESKESSWVGDTRTILVCCAMRFVLNLQTVQSDRVLKPKFNGSKSANQQPHNKKQIAHLAFSAPICGAKFSHRSPRPCIWAVLRRPLSSIATHSASTQANFVLNCTPGLNCKQSLTYRRNAAENSIDGPHGHA